MRVASRDPHPHEGRGYVSQQSPEGRGALAEIRRIWAEVDQLIADAPRPEQARRIADLRHALRDAPLGPSRQAPPRPTETGRALQVAAGGGAASSPARAFGANGREESNVTGASNIAWSHRA